VETKEQIEGDKNKEIEYTYDKQGNLVQVKSSLENEKAQYVSMSMTSRATRCAGLPA